MKDSRSSKQNAESLEQDFVPLEFDTLPEASEQFSDAGFKGHKDGRKKPSQRSKK